MEFALRSEGAFQALDSFWRAVEEEEQAVIRYNKWRLESPQEAFFWSGIVLHWRRSQEFWFETLSLYHSGEEV